LPRRRRASGLPRKFAHVSGVPDALARPARARASGALSESAGPRPGHASRLGQTTCPLLANMESPLVPGFSPAFGSARESDDVCFPGASGSFGGRNAAPAAVPMQGVWLPPFAWPSPTGQPARAWAGVGVARSVLGRRASPGGFSALLTLPLRRELAPTLAERHQRTEVFAGRGDIVRGGPSQAGVHLMSAAPNPPARDHVCPRNADAGTA